ncbi:helix-turn-helix domain-containing protein [Streptomyces sp. NPDC051219]|uniref:helix-turn-helix transcriptional regulator n=1 Tax=Streptomyces sp. NPDC051219 TaxID=3155283 RepID=UPI003447D8F4
MTRSLAAPSAAEPKFLTTDEVADRYRTAASTVRYWRYVGYGPRGRKVGRRVLYDVAELDRWDADQAGDAAA